MHLARVFEPFEPNKADPLSKRRFAHPPQHGVATLIRLDDDVDSGEASEMVSVGTLAPQAGAGQAHSVDAVVPKRVAITLALDDDDRSLTSKPPKAVEEGFRADRPANGHLDPETPRSSMSEA